MSDYKRVGEALQDGADPSMICATCPWDRHCISPPTMTSEEIAAETERMKREDDERAARDQADGKSGFPMGALLSAVMFAGKDTQAQVCPVFVSRMRSSGGREIADTLKSAMTAWDDNEVRVP